MDNFGNNNMMNEQTNIKSEESLKESRAEETNEKVNGQHCNEIGNCYW